MFPSQVKGTTTAQIVCLHASLLLGIRQERTPTNHFDFASHGTCTIHGIPQSPEPSNKHRQNELVGEGPPETTMYQAHTVMAAAMQTMERYGGHVVTVQVQSPPAPVVQMTMGL
jgi:hypothetical protein